MRIHVSQSKIMRAKEKTHVFAHYVFSLDKCEISWIDEDGDSINVQSSEDLVHALYAMKDTAFIKFNLLESKAVQAEVFYNFKN